MGVLLREALRKLCVETGWSYAVFWRAIGGFDRMHLVWEDGHCERTSGAAATSGFEAMDLLIKESGLLRSSQNVGFGDLGCHVEDRVRTMVYKLMATQVHVVGDGIIGRAALTGNHEWIHGEILGDSESIAKGLAEMTHQFSAGIQTVAIVPVLPHGIVQLGSTRMAMENMGLINHVKILFHQLGCVPGALLSDISQKTLNRKIQLNASFRMHTSINQFGEVGTNVNSLSSLDADNNKLQPVGHKDSRVVTEPSRALRSEVCDKMLASAAEVSLAEENITGRMMPPIRSSLPMLHPVVKPGLCLGNQLESGNQETHVKFSNPDRMLMKNVPQDSRSKSQFRPPADLPSSRLKLLDEHLFSVPCAGQQEPANNNESRLDNANIPQMRYHRCTSSDFLGDSDTILSFSRGGLENSSTDFGRFRSLPSGRAECGRGQHAISSSSEVVRVLNQTNDLFFNQMRSSNIDESCPAYITPRIPTGTSAEKQNTASDLFQALGGASVKCDEHGFCYRSLLNSLQDSRVQKSRRNHDSACIENDTCDTPNGEGTEKLEILHDSDTSSPSPLLSSGNTLFDLLPLDCKSTWSHGCLEDATLRSNDLDTLELSTDVSTCITQLGESQVFDALNNDICCSEMFSNSGSDQLLDAVVSQINSGAKQDTEDNVSYKTSITNVHPRMASSEHIHGELFELPPVIVKSEVVGASSLKSSCSMDRTDRCFSQRNGAYKSQISLWVENGQNMNCDNISTTNIERADEVGKLNRKRSRPGENPRPRPKDRQMIQDRVKELREIVPNGAKCSIDALLEKTIKHMLFLQSVTKHADKLKENVEPKITSKEGGLLLKDNFEGGATWAFEVGSQSMICPIVVEDLNPPRQMLVEMLCEERGLFLEIADLVRGLGLTILKGVMESRNDKVWARFAVEANRDVTRMEIFLSLLRLLEPITGSSKTTEGVDNLNKQHSIFRPPSSIPVTGLSDHLW